MFQWIGGTKLFIVDIKTWPVNLPVRGDLPGTWAYAKALTKAIKDGIITEPGKYGIEVDKAETRFEIYKIIEE